MEDKLVTLAIHTFEKAQILKTILETEGIEVYIHNVNQIQPVVSAGVRVRIKESDLRIGHPRSPLLFPVILHFMGYEIPYLYIICIGIIGDFYRFL